LLDANKAFLVVVRMQRHNWIVASAHC
jgi:hypothetical protein